MTANTIVAEGCTNFRRFLVEGTRSNRKKIAEYRSLMPVTALSPVIGYDKASAIAHTAHKHDLSLKEAALKSGYIDESRFDEIVDPRKMIGRGVAGRWCIAAAAFRASLDCSPFTYDA
jgi:fumarate hydratase class II